MSRLGRLVDSYPSLLFQSAFSRDCLNTNNQVNELKTISSTINVVEKANIIGKENVKTEAGTFKDCLKIEYRSITTTKTTAASQIKQLLPEQKPNETTTTLWLAPNVGIVKFTSEKKQSDEKTVYELKSYEIKSDESYISNND